MARRSALVFGSLAVHAALAVGVGEIEVKKSHASTAISYAETKKKPKPPEPAKVDPTPPEKAPNARALAHRAPAPAEEAAPPPSKAAENPALDGLPDFGVSLTGGVNGTGIALPLGGGGAARPQTVEKVQRLPKAVAAALPAEGDCDEPATKPKALSVRQPQYTPDAISAAVEGKVRVQLTVDATGKVIDVKVIQGLGHGLDEAALQAARESSFEPAQHCGKAVQATFTIAMRFKLPS